MVTHGPLLGAEAVLPASPAGRAAARLLACLGADVAQAGADSEASLLDGASTYRGLLLPGSGGSGELTFAAACGALELTGDPDRAPAWPSVPLCGGLLGLALAFTLLAELLRGVDQPSPGTTASLDTQRWLTYLLGTARSHWETGAAPRRRGPRSATMTDGSPYPDTLLPCADGHIYAHYAPSDPALLAALLESEAPLSPLAVEADAVDQRLSEWLVSRTRLEAATRAQELRHAFVPVTTMAELLAAYAHGLPPPVAFLDRGTGDVRPVPAGPLPLTGLRVLELGVAVAGPMAGELLASLGATVTRLAHPVGATPGWYDRNKRTVVADLSTGAGRASLRDLLAESDVFLTNLSARSQQNLGLAESVEASSPGLVSVAITAFPSGDARHWWSAFDAGMQAVVGLADATRYPGGGPLRVAGHPLDGATALIAACAALAALRGRRNTGLGRRAEVSMLGAGLLLMAPAIEAPRESQTPGHTSNPTAAAAPSAALPDLVLRGQAWNWLPF
ncbi:MAG: hypothetical protein EXR52_05435 [Dehalococcoidia bacterium]|nr:hypothetical protein [Dehalococcoidia bacterium]